MNTKKIISVIFALILVLSSVSLAFAAEDHPNYVVDNANLLTDDQEDALNERLKTLSENEEFTVAVVTTDDTDGKSIQDFADDTYDYGGYGYGDDNDGVLLVISMAERDWYITTCGFGITAFTDDGIDDVGDQMVNYLSDGDYAGAFEVFAEVSEKYIKDAKAGISHDDNYDDNYDYDGDDAAYYGSAFVIVGVRGILIALGVGFVISGIVVLVMRGKLKSVRSKTEANSYVKPNSMNITASSDTFLYSNVTCTARPKNDSSSGSDSSTHTSSSGTTHGGGGGKF